jgi:methylenetetrahydrofolate--tRNA-(uracil-5-)-methyltransferase
VLLYEMRPVRQTPAHQTSWLAELVCSNSLKSAALDTAPGLLKEELRRVGSLVLHMADAARIPAGSALAVDREQFARSISEAITSHASITLRREEVRALPSDLPTIIATGPLTSEVLAEQIRQLSGESDLYFTMPSPHRGCLNHRLRSAFSPAAMAKEMPGSPIAAAGGISTLTGLTHATVVPFHVRGAALFEACLPIEEIASVDSYARLWTDAAGGIGDGGRHDFMPLARRRPMGSALIWWDFKRR